MNFNCVFIISLLSPSNMVTGAKVNYNEILLYLYQPEKLIFDVTNPYNNEPSGADGLLSPHGNLNESGIRLSPIIYYRRDESHYNNTKLFLCNSIEDLIPNTCEFIHKPSLYFLVSGSRRANFIGMNLTSPLLSTLLNASRNIRDQVFKVIFPHQKSEPWLDPQLRRQIAEKQGKLISFLKSEWPHIKIGLEYDDGSYWDDSILLVVNQVDIIILNIDIPLEELSLSYSTFKSKLASVLHANSEFLHKSANLTNHVTTYVKLNFPKEELRKLIETSIDGPLYAKYYYYLLQFSVFWLNEGHKEGIVLGAFSTSTASQIGLDGTGMREIVTVPISDRIRGLQIGSCEIRAMLQQITSAKFKTMTLNHFGLERILYVDKCLLMNNSANCDKVFPRPCTEPKLNSTLSPWPDIHLRYRIFTNGANSTRWLIHIADLLSHLPWKIIEIDLAWKDVDNATLSSVINGLRTLPPGIIVACTASSAFKDAHGGATMVGANGQQIKQIIQRVYEECVYIWNESKLLVWDIYIESLDILPSDLTSKLISLENNRHTFLKIFPEKTIMLRVNLGIKDDDERIMRSTYMSGNRFGLYCNPSLLKMNTLGEIVITFARLHNIPLEIRDVLGHFDQDGGGWRLLETLGALENVTNTFPMFVARDYPEHFPLGNFHVDPCLKWTENVSQDGVRIHQDFAGTTIYMSGMRSDNEPLTPDELQILLLFVLHKFTLVEVIADNIADLGTLLHVLSLKEFTQKLQLPDLDNDNDVVDKAPKLYLKVNWNFSSNPQNESMLLWNLLDKLETVALIPLGIHFASPQNISQFKDNYDLEFSKLRNEGFLLGLVLEDCLNEVNQGFFNLRYSQLFQRVNYVVCNVEHVAIASNVDRQTTGKYLDTTLFIQRYFQEVFTSNNKSINVELLFRLNSSPTQAYSSRNDKEFAISEVSNFLRFFSDVSQYAGLYRIKFFMLPAFDDQSGKKYGWWKISNFADLTDASVFVDEEAKYLGRETWRPPSERTGTSSPSDGWDIITRVILPSMVASILILMSALLMIVIWYRRRFAILTRREVEEFRYGQSGGVGSRSDQEGAVGKRMFSTEYEIAQNRFVLLNIIGKGNFGLVYNANLSNPDGSGSTPVAVKTPHLDCTKDSLKSMLSELKVLCYVGSHPHVIGFIGAYIAELGKGKIYIATELCENGALLEHLRKLDLGQINEKLSEERSDVNYELIRFSHEISLGMEYIASKKIVHGDLSARNVLLDTNKHCKIADFGLSRKLYQYQEYVKKNAEPLPWRWMAVESLKRMEFTTKSDVWSFGVTMWEIFSLGSIPYPGLSWTTNFAEELENGLRMSAPKYASRDLYDKMRECWDTNPVDRPNFNELVQFFTLFRDKEYIMI